MKLTKAQRAELIRLARADIVQKCVICDCTICKGRLVCAECAKALRENTAINTNA